MISSRSLKKPYLLHHTTWACQLRRFPSSNKQCLQPWLSFVSKPKAFFVRRIAGFPGHVTIQCREVEATKRLKLTLSIEIYNYEGVYGMSQSDYVLTIR